LPLLSQQYRAPEGTPAPLNAYLESAFFDAG
jgi:hypothetical protein